MRTAAFAQLEERQVNSVMASRMHARYCISHTRVGTNYHLQCHQHHVVHPTLASVIRSDVESLYPAGISSRLHHWHVASVGLSARISSFGSAGCYRQYSSFQLRHSRTRRLTTCAIMSTSGGQQVAEWQHNIPYLLASDDKDFHIKYTASCLCGEVQYAVDCDPVAAKFCHCTSCQRLHGNLPASALSQTSKQLRNNL